MSNQPATAPAEAPPAGLPAPTSVHREAPVPHWRIRNRRPGTDHSRDLHIHTIDRRNLGREIQLRQQTVKEPLLVDPARVEELCAALRAAAAWVDTGEDQ